MRLLWSGGVCEQAQLLAGGQRALAGPRPAPRHPPTPVSPPPPCPLSRLSLAFPTLTQTPAAHAPLRYQSSPPIPTLPFPALSYPACRPCTPSQAACAREYRHTNTRAHTHAQCLLPSHTLSPAAQTPIAHTHTTRACTQTHVYLSDTHARASTHTDT